MPESTQHKLDRIRPPRVQITYDVETRGSFVKMELPFVVGIMANLSGNVDDPNRAPLRDRKYMEIDRDNFNDIMKSIGPKASINGTELAFTTLDDFSPIKVLGQLPANEKFGKRTRLSDMVAKLDGNVKLQKKFLEVLTSEDQLKKMKTDLEALKQILAKQNGVISGNGGGDTVGGGDKSSGAGDTGTVETPKKSKGGDK
jgi:type VI secretion system protein ImpB